MTIKKDLADLKEAPRDEIVDRLFTILGLVESKIAGQEFRFLLVFCMLAISLMDEMTEVQAQSAVKHTEASWNFATKAKHIIH